MSIASQREVRSGAPLIDYTRMLCWHNTPISTLYPVTFRGANVMCSKWK